MVAPISLECTFQSPFKSIISQCVGGQYPAVLKLSFGCNAFLPVLLKYIHVFDKLCLGIDTIIIYCIFFPWTTYYDNCYNNVLFRGHIPNVWYRLPSCLYRHPKKKVIIGIHINIIKCFLFQWIGDHLSASREPPETGMTHNPYWKSLVLFCFIENLLISDFFFNVIWFLVGDIVEDLNPLGTLDSRKGKGMSLLVNVYRNLIMDQILFFVQWILLSL